MATPDPGTKGTGNEYVQNRYNSQRSGLGQVGQYQMGGIPYITSSIPVPVLTTAAPGLHQCPVEISFPFVSKFVTVINTNSGSNAPLRVGFSRTGVVGQDAGPASSVARNYFVLNNGETYTGEWRVASVFLVGAAGGNGIGGYAVTSASVIAGLTGIPASSLLSGSIISNWTGSSGVG